MRVLIHGAPILYKFIKALHLTLHSFLLTCPGERSLFVDNSELKVTEAKNILSWKGPTRVESNSWRGTGQLDQSHPVPESDVQALLELCQGCSCDHFPGGPVPVGENLFLRANLNFL